MAISERAASRLSIVIGPHRYDVTMFDGTACALGYAEGNRAALTAALDDWNLAPTLQAHICGHDVADDSSHLLASHIEESRRMG